MGLDPVTGIGTGCWPGMVRLADYLFAKFGGWNLGCFNPASRAGGGPSLHAEGRAQDFAFNANDPDERAAGDALFTWAVQHAEEIGLQEMLWRGAIWYFPRKDSEDGWGDFPLPGVYGPVQQADHMSHVHMGVDKNAGMNWQPDWITGDDVGLDIKDVEWMQNTIAGVGIDGQTIISNRKVLDAVLALNAKIDAIPAGSGGGLTEAQVREIVRSELDKTRLAH